MCVNHVSVIKTQTLEPQETSSYNCANLKTQEISKSRYEGKNLNNYFQLKRLPGKLPGSTSRGRRSGTRISRVCYKRGEMSMFSWDVPESDKRKTR